MFKKNENHIQAKIFGISTILPQEYVKRIEESEEQAFYELVFCNIREESFACVYSEKYSRPNSPINCLVGAILLQHRNHWTVEQLFKNIGYNLLTKTALGLSTFDEMPFNEATFFNFQNRLNQHFVTTGNNLLEQVFDSLTKEQLKRLGIKTNIQRTDSFQAASNIRRYSRLQLLAEKPLLVISILFALAFSVSAFLTARKGIEFTPFYFSGSPDFFFLLAANVGAVIMPFMLFYQASATAEKGIKAGSLWAVRLETAIGAIASEVIMVAIAIAATGVEPDSLNFASPVMLSGALYGVAGRFAPPVFAIGLIAASFIALIVISLGSCWGVTEALGWGRKNWFKVYLAESLPALVVPIITLNLVNMALNLMVLQIIVLMGPAIILGFISSNKRLMGNYTLGVSNKIVYWVFLALIFGTGIISMMSFL